MAVSIVAGSAVASAGAAGNAVQSATPTLPSGTASLDRVFIFAAAVGTLSTPSNWTSLSNSALGGGTAGAGTGTRNTAVFYRDYDGVWTMPLVSAAAVSANAIAVAAVTMRCAGAEVWNAPTVTTGSDTTSGVGYSAAGSSTASTTNGGVLLATSLPGTSTTSSASLTQTAAAFSALTNSVTSGGNASGNGAAVTAYTATVTTGATAAPTHAMTLGTARTGGTVFVFQTTTAANPPPVALTVFTQAALNRASYW